SVLATKGTKKRFFEGFTEFTGLKQNPVNLVNPVKINLVCLAQRRRDELFSHRGHESSYLTCGDG
ncbi:MAG: hypothetical protein J6333_06870, partial [Planctomycetes bacterium]|nr:hypothetical protein [Planctomycetota bacterium]